MQRIFILSLLLTICGCTSKGEIYHGYTFNDVGKIDEKIPTLQHSTKKKVELELGSPTFIEKYSGNSSYFYVEDVFQKTPFIWEDKIFSKVLRIDFDSNETVKSVQMYRVDGKGYFNNKDKTIVKGHQMGFFEQMKRNLMSVGKAKDE